MEILKLAGKFNLPVIIQAPKQEKVAFTSIILKEMKKSHVEKAIINQCDRETMQLVLRDHNENIKVGLTVGKQGVAPEEALRIYRNFSYDERICLNSGLGLKETSLFGLISTLELFEEQFPEDLIKKLTFHNYLDVFPSISAELRREY